MEAARNTVGVTVSYWRALEEINVWRANVEHLSAQQTGRDKWYSAYSVRIAKVGRACEWTAD
ncbi:MAG: heme-degrading monooxygenase HmoA [Bradymonadia bacterium]|jgi:heme-degrading monooxygenase HmoA